MRSDPMKLRTRFTKNRANEQINVYQHTSLGIGNLQVFQSAVTFESFVNQGLLC